MDIGVDPFDTIIGFKGKIALVLVACASIITSSAVGYHYSEQYDKENISSGSLYVFEMVRHGARAPLIAIEGSTFPVPE